MRIAVIPALLLVLTLLGACGARRPEGKEPAE
jgi:hypothetical protein